MNNMTKQIDTQTLRESFAITYPKDHAMISLAEHNKDYWLESIAARHRWTAFQAGAKAASTPPAGMKLVPVVLTHEVRRVLLDKFEKHQAGASLMFVDIWNDLLAAASNNNEQKES